MVRVSPIQTNFTAGELSPLLYGRADIAKYANGAKTIRNAIVQPHGGATRRPGTRFVAAVKDSTKVTRLAPFQFSTQQAYILELGDAYIRFFKDQGQIVAAHVTAAISNGAFDADITGWTSFSTGAAAISWGVTGVLNLVGAASSIAIAEQSIAITETATKHLVRFRVDGIAGVDKVRVRVGTTSGGTELVNDYDATPGWHIIGFTPGVTSVYLQFRNENADTVAIDDVAILGAGMPAGAPVELPSPYAAADLFALKPAQSADTLYIAHPDYAPYKLLRFDHDEWALVRVGFKDGPYLDENTTATTLTPSATSGLNITLTASGTDGINGRDGFKASDIGRPVRLKNGADWGWATIAAIGSPTVVTAHVGGAFSAITANTAWRLGAWHDGAGYPTCVTFHEQRLCWGGEKGQPQIFRTSKTNDFEHMAPSDADGLLVADNALNYAIGANQVNAIRWMSAIRSLVLGTTGGTWPVRANSLDEPLTPANIQIKRANTFGAGDVAPIEVGDVVIYLSPTTRKFRELAFLFERDNFAAPDLTILSEHISAGGVTQLAHAQEPHGVTYAPRQDGVLIGMTYEREQNVVAWQHHILGGRHDGGAAKAESVAVIPSPGNDYSQLWCLVRRTVNGVAVRHVEYMENFLAADDDVRDAYFVDCGLSYDDPQAITGATQASPVVVTATGHGFSNGDLVDITGIAGMTGINDRRFTIANVTANTFELPGEDGTGHAAYVTGGVARRAVTAVSGLGHLEGETLDILADGAVMVPQTVSGGAITLTRPASRVHVGYGYVTDVETLPLDAVMPDGTAQGRTKRIDHVVLRLYNSVGVKIGPDAAHLDDVKFGYGTVMDLPAPLFTGDKALAFPGGYDTSATVLIRQDRPLPLTVLAVMPRIDIAAR